MKAKTILVRNIINLENQLDAITGPDFIPCLAIAFASVSLPLEAFAAVFAKHHITLIGSSSCGEIWADGNNTNTTERSAAVMLLELDQQAYTTDFTIDQWSDSYQLGREGALKLQGKFAHQAYIIMASGLHTNGQALIEGFVSIAGDDAIIFGGLAGDDALFKETWVFSDQQFSNKGLVVLCLDADRIAVSGLATSGWIGLGAVLKVTSAKGNIVYAIDGLPALDVYMKYLSVNEDDLPSIGVEYPLMLKRSNGTNAQRAVMGVDKQARSLLFAGTVPEGSLVNFSSSPGFEIIEVTRRHLDSFAANTAPPDCCLLFSCMARHLALGPLIAEEVKIAVSKWAVPLAGFFTYGEIGTNANQHCDFFNQTFTIVLLNEKKE
ncbi:MAG: FIST C-terminal domain-containing protein [Bacteroidetes bacterium]|nr:FIST C-terminal domain-containing protein [Bacteroidota bacterium]